MYTEIIIQGIMSLDELTEIYDFLYNLSLTCKLMNRTIRSLLPVVYQKLRIKRYPSQPEEQMRNLDRLILRYGGKYDEQIPITLLTLASKVPLVWGTYMYIFRQVLEIYHGPEILKIPHSSEILSYKYFKDRQLLLIELDDLHLVDLKFFQQLI